MYCGKNNKKKKLEPDKSNEKFRVIIKNAKKLFFKRSKKMPSTG